MGTAGATAEIRNSIGFAGDIPGKTGLYAAFGCQYAAAPATGTAVPFLDQIGSFSVRGSNVDGVHIVASHPALAGLTDALLSNWGQSTHAGFTSFPEGFIPLAIQIGITGNGSLSFADGTSGVPYMLARGEGLQAVGLNISMSGPATGNVGANITYTITYANTGNAAANSVVITDPLPANTTFVSASGGGSHVGANVVWNLGTLNAGVTGQTVTLTVALNAPGTITNENYTIAASQVAPVAGTPVETLASGTLPTPAPPAPCIFTGRAPCHGFYSEPVDSVITPKCFVFGIGRSVAGNPASGRANPHRGRPSNQWDLGRFMAGRPGWLAEWFCLPNLER